MTGNRQDDRGLPPLSATQPAFTAPAGESEAMGQTAAIELIPFSCLAELQFAGVYLLCLKGQVVYVGQARNIRRRLGDHVRECSKEFDSVSVRACDERHLDRLERSLIRHFAPKYNKCGLAKNSRLNVGYRNSHLGQPAGANPEMKAAEAAAYLGVTMPAFLDLIRQPNGPRSRRVDRQRHIKAYFAEDLRMFAATAPDLLEAARKGHG